MAEMAEMAPLLTITQVLVAARVVTRGTEVTVEIWELMVLLVLEAAAVVVAVQAEEMVAVAAVG